MGMPEPGSDKFERMIDFMRVDLDSNMGLSKIIQAGRRIVEADGRDFEENKDLWLKNGGHEVMKKKGAVLFPSDIEILNGSRNRTVRKNPEEDARVKELYDIWASL